MPDLIAKTIRTNGKNKRQIIQCSQFEHNQIMIYLIGRDPNCAPALTFAEQSALREKISNHCRWLVSSLIACCTQWAKQAFESSSNSA